MELRAPCLRWAEVMSEEPGVRQDESEIHLSKTEARAGITPHVTRYILAISGILVIVVLTAVVLLGQ